MAFLYVENFEAGLDTRKTAFTAPPGSLRVLRNAHITRGKEIERRKAFAPFADLPADTHGLHSVQDQLFTFGSVVEPAGMPPTVTYQRLQSVSGGAMTRLVSAENFQGKIYAIAEYATGEVHHFYDGVRVADWETLAGDIAGRMTVAQALGVRMDGDDAFNANVVGNRVILTAREAGVSTTVSSPTTEITVTERQAAAAAQPEVKASADVTITGGSPGQTFNTISIVRVDDVDLIGSPVDYEVDNATTAQALANRINSYTSAYEATVSAATVTILAQAGLGAAANGRVLEVQTEGDVTVTADAQFSGGQDPVPAVPQITDVFVDTFAAATVYEVDISTRQYRILGKSSAIPLAIRAVKEKMYAVTSSLLYFSGLAGDPPRPDPTQWINSGTAPVVTGAGFIDMSSQYSGSELLVGLGVYQGRVAVFSRRAVQIWNVDPDPARNTPYQVLLNVGAVAPESIVEYGDLDIFFLSDTGMRSLRARDSSNLASANDVGVAIDGELTEYMSNISRQAVREAKAVVEPNDGRYLIALGTRIYAFSNFPGSRVAAWSTYDTDAPVEEWAVTTNQLYARIGDTVRLYGGLSGNEYDSSETEIILPFLDAGSPAARKQLQSLDVGAVGIWLIEMNSEPNFEGEWETLHSILESTFGSTQRLGAQAKSTHFSLRFTTSKPVRAVLGNVVIEFRDIN